MAAYEAQLTLTPRAEAPAGGEPITVGVPWARGALGDAADATLFDAAGRPQCLQRRVLERWGDGSVRWLLCDFAAELRAPSTWCLRAEPQAVPQSSALSVVRVPGSVVVRRGAREWVLGTESGLPHGASVAFIDAAGRRHEPRFEIVEPECLGPIRSTVRCEGTIASLRLTLRWSFFSHCSAQRVELTLHNPRAAQHAGGLWDLGDPGSMLFRALSLRLRASPSEATLDFGDGERSYPVPLELQQHSSGGEQWRSPAHVNRSGRVPLATRGYTLRAGERRSEGARAQALLRAAGLRVAMPEFWERFPSGLRADAAGIELQLFPGAHPDLHELQGGEQVTERFYVDPDDGSLGWALAPMQVRARPEDYAAAIPNLLPRSTDPHLEHLALVDLALDFPRKREVIDEYGWRHFGELYADHEAVSHEGPVPFVSHYNNQYDGILGLLLQGLRGGGPSFVAQGDALARHVANIDIYRTEEDKAAYNGGLFWHTYHYVEAGRATHRAYSADAGVDGGGPSAEQCYASGLRLHHCLTGDPVSKDAALRLGRWIYEMEDGQRTPYRWLARGDTGYSTSSGTPDYHGPGRGAGNAIVALIDAHRLSGEGRYLERAEKLIRRCIHPETDIEALRLEAVERRWYYMVFLHALGTYLNHKAEREALDRAYDHAQSSLLHFARWAAEHEYPYLEKPEILEYPNETWAAQEMRKAEVFVFAAMHTGEAEERERFIERARFFHRNSIETLQGWETRALTRPVVLMLRYGGLLSWYEAQAEPPRAPRLNGRYNHGDPESFTPQRQRAMKRLGR